ncbi:MAG: HAD-IC family P-type ATPase, partial [Erysipelotrichales bacterium]
MKLKVSGLDCVNCAMDIENELKKDKRLSDVVVDFASQSISFNKQDDISIDEIKAKVVEVESDVSFVEDEKSKYILNIKGLDCANCAMEVESELKKKEELDNVVVDFASQKIIFNASSNIDLDKIKKEVKDIEPDVNFIDGNSSVNKFTYNVGGLDCASCAADFERALNEQPEIESAIVDFAQSRVIIEYSERDYDVVEKVASQMEDDLVISKVDRSKKDVIKSDIDYSLIWSVLISALIVAITIIFKFEGNLKFGAYLVAYIIAAYDVLIKLVKNLVKGKVFDENFLMGIATVAAFAIGENLEAIAVIVFYKVGEFMQQLAVNNSRRSIGGLMDIKAEYANLLIDGKIRQIDPNEVKIGEHVVIKPGEKIPLDGVVIEGTTYLDTKALTGESKAVKVEVGEDVLSGSINTDSMITIEVTKVFNDSTVAKILDLVENSSANKAPTENFITKFARVYTPIVVIIAALVAFLPPIILNQEFYPWIYKALIFLVISCPCALVISVPLGFFGGIGNASKHGILIKGANYLEALNSV